MPNWIKKDPVGLYASDDPILTKLEAIYGISDIDEFLNPQQHHMHDPYTMKNAEIAAVEIIKAITAGEKICISFDVDADGITAGSVMHRYLRQFTRPNTLSYCYTERSEGHGIENQLDKIPEGTQMLIVVDSSSNSVDACKTLIDAGIKVIILDHHPVNEGGNPYALLVNPQQNGCMYPNKELSGAGVVYKVLEIIDDTLCGANPLLTDLTDLVAVGMSADMMSASEMENRYLISHGLRNINNPGLLAILKVAKKNPKYDKMSSEIIGFTIGPFLNGAARMGNLGLAIDLLLEDNDFVCVTYAKQIRDLNNQRKEIEANLFSDLNEQVDTSDKFVIVSDKDIDKSFNGLVATKFSGVYQRPAIVFQENGSFLSGSYRGVGNFNMKEFLREFKSHMEQYLELPTGENYGFVEGHAQAGGFGIYKNDLGYFKRYVETKLKDTDFESGYVYDLALRPDEITSPFMKNIEKFQWISGKDHPTPKFMICGLEAEAVNVIGQNNDTVKIDCANDFVVIKFKVANAHEVAQKFLPVTDKNGKVIKNIRFNVVGQLNVNGFYHGGLKKMVYTNQLYLEDFAIIE